MKSQNIVLLPGLACDAELWRGQLPALAGRAWVHVSDVIEREPTLPAMAARLLAEHPGELWLAGASMGGMLALEAQRQAPARVRGLALLGTSARADTPELVRLRTDAIALFEQGQMEDVLQANVMFAFHPDSQSDTALTERYLRMIRRAGAAQLVRQNRALMGRIDSRPLLAAVRCPTLVVCGEADLMTPPEHAREIAAAIPGARLEMLAGAGHMLTMEQPERVATLLQGWFRP